MIQKHVRLDREYTVIVVYVKNRFGEDRMADNMCDTYANSNLRQSARHESPTSDTKVIKKKKKF